MAALVASRTRMAATFASAALVALSGCGDDDGGTDPDPPGPSATPGATLGVDPVGSDGEVSYPETVAEYAEATVAAWAAPDLIRLAELATGDVHAQIVDFPGPPNLDWTFIACPEDAVPAVCTFHNADGDYLRLTIAPELVAQPYAVVAVELEVTPYLDDPQAYVEAFVTAWQLGNPPRMDNLAITEAADVLRQLPPEPEVDYRVGKADQDQKQITVVIVLAEAEIRTRLTTALLGEPEAIRTAEIRER